MQPLSKLFSRLSVFLAFFLTVVDTKKHFILVGHWSNVVTPDTIVSSPGDEVEFQFPEESYNIVRGDYNLPCKPITKGPDSRFPDPLSSGRLGGDIYYENDPDFYNTWTVQINTTKPIWFYDCYNCDGSMAGVINPPPQDEGETLEEWKSKHDKLHNSARLGTESCFVFPNGTFDKRQKGGRLGKKNPARMERPTGNIPMVTTTMTVTTSATGSATSTPLVENNSGSGGKVAVSYGMLAMTGIVAVLRALTWRLA